MPGKKNCHHFKISENEYIVNWNYLYFLLMLNFEFFLFFLQNLLNHLQIKPVKVFKFSQNLSKIFFDIPIEFKK